MPGKEPRRKRVGSLSLRAVPADGTVQSTPRAFKPEASSLKARRAKSGVSQSGKRRSRAGSLAASASPDGQYLFGDDDNEDLLQTLRVDDSDHGSPTTAVFAPEMPRAARVPPHRGLAYSASTATMTTAVDDNRSFNRQPSSSVGGRTPPSVLVTVTPSADNIKSSPKNYQLFNPDRLRTDDDAGSDDSAKTLRLDDGHSHSIFDVSAPGSVSGMSRQVSLVEVSRETSDPERDRTSPHQRRSHGSVSYAASDALAMSGSGAWQDGAPEMFTSSPRRPSTMRRDEEEPKKGGGGGRFLGVHGGRGQAADEMEVSKQRPRAPAMDRDHAQKQKKLEAQVRAKMKAWEEAERDFAQLEEQAKNIIAALKTEQHELETLLKVTGSHEEEEDEGIREARNVAQVRYDALPKVLAATKDFLEKKTQEHKFNAPVWTAEEEIKLRGIQAQEKIAGKARLEEEREAKRRQAAEAARHYGQEKSSALQPKAGARRARATTMSASASVNTLVQSQNQPTSNSTTPTVSVIQSSEQTDKNLTPGPNSGAEQMLADVQKALGGNRGRRRTLDRLSLQRQRKASPRPSIDRGALAAEFGVVAGLVVCAVAAAVPRRAPSFRRRGSGKRRGSQKRSGSLHSMHSMGSFKALNSPRQGSQTALSARDSDDSEISALKASIRTALGGQSGLATSLGGASIGRLSLGAEASASDHSGKSRSGGGHSPRLSPRNSFRPPPTGRTEIQASPLFSEAPLSQATTSLPLGQTIPQPDDGTGMPLAIKVIQPLDPSRSPPGGSRAPLLSPGMAINVALPTGVSSKSPDNPSLKWVIPNSAGGSPEHNVLHGYTVEPLTPKARSRRGSRGEASPQIFALQTMMERATQGDSRSFSGRGSPVPKLGNLLLSSRDSSECSGPTQAAELGLALADILVAPAPAPCEPWTLAVVALTMTAAAANLILAPPPASPRGHTSVDVHSVDFWTATALRRQGRVRKGEVQRDSRAVAQVWGDGSVEPLADFARSILSREEEEAGMQVALAGSRKGSPHSSPPRTAPRPSPRDTRPQIHPGLAWSVGEWETPEGKGADIVQPAGHAFWSRVWPETYG
eukprot:Hpha_TRINITY_DN6387_c0_g2::TRINITY_DN6387_c0_g2_i1::g.145502::m.145502